MKTAVEISQELNGKASGDGFMACCPAHDDQNPSLSITEKDGKVLFHCFAGCSQQRVIEALKNKGVFNMNVSKKTSGHGKPRLDLDLRASEYKKNLTTKMKNFLIIDRRLSEKVICDFNLGQSNDRLSIPVKGLDNKVQDIRLYLPPSERKGKVAKILPDVNTDGSATLYPSEIIPWLKQAAALNTENLDILEPLGNLDPVERAGLILICEGELDALAAISIGYPAITNTCGANAWKSHFSERIADLNLPVVILMDNDSSGKKGAEERAESLSNLGVKVSIASWPSDRLTGHDITDELIKYGRESLLSIIMAAESYSDIVYMNEVIAEDVNWLFKPFIAIGKTTILEGEPGIGKSFLSLEIAARTSIGAENPLKSEEPIPSGKVLLMSAEDGLADTIKPRLEKMNSELTKIFAPKEIFTLDDKGFQTLDALIARERPLLVIIDPMTPFLDGKKDTNKASDMRPFFKNLAKLASTYSCAILITRHLAKSKDQTGVSRGLGSIDIAAAVRSILQVTADEEYKDLKRVTHVKSNIGTKGKPFGYRLDDGVFSWAGELSEITDEGKDIPGELERACDFLLDALKDGPMDAVDVNKAAKDINISNATLKRAKKKVRIRSKRITNSGERVLWTWSIYDSQVFQGDQEVHESQSGPPIHYNDPETYRTDV